MFSLPKYKNPVSLIPDGCPQMLDYAAPVTSIEDVKYAFQEIIVTDKTGQKKVQLRAFRKNADKEFADELDPSIIYDGTGYELSGAKEIAPWLGEWIPVPFLRTREQKWPDSDEPRFECGPSNWARARLVVNSGKADVLRLVLAFDMQTEAKNADNYTALSKEDVDANAHFRLAWRFRDNSWFLDLPWVEEWLRETWEAWRKKTRRKIQEDEPKFSHLASYLVFLETICKISGQCEVYVVRPDSSPPVNVDLVLDIGNSRTTGMLVETRAQSVTNLNDGYLLQLRDMSEPENIYSEPFETRIEFSEVSFGSDALSLRSGRRTSAFSWPSPVRIGPEAARLSARSRSGKGATGMSSPKRYLWDERDWKASWRYNTGTEKTPYVTRGALAQQVNSSGTPLCCMDDPLFNRNRILRKQERESAFESYFTRSSMMMFLLAEIIQQALITINSPGQRCKQEQFDKPRRLRQIIFTVPSGMPKAEQKIYTRWAKWAVRVLWESLGWGQFYIGQNQRALISGQYDYRTSPVIRCDWDEATCTQLVYIYNEVTRQFQGDAKLFCSLAGREREFDGRKAPSVRVAAIDIGGGTTDLSITTFELAGDAGATPRMAPHPEFHDGFNLAGDDILREVISSHVLAPLGAMLEKNGIPDAKTALAQLFGRDIMNTSAETRNRRGQFIRQIAVPAGLHLLALYEKADMLKEPSKIVFRLADCFKEQQNKIGGNAPGFAMPGEGAISYINDYAKEHGNNPDFNVFDCELVMDAAIMDETVRSALRDILANLCEVINLYDCDALLLTGRPSRWPGVVNTVYSLMPVPPGKIFPMSEYRVGSWYPFSDALGNITDPKTTVVAGAILCALAEGHLEGFSFDSGSLSLNSTARYIGEMEINGQIKKDKVWFSVIPEKNISAPEVAKISFTGPMAVGFRQLEAERWTTTRYYMLDFIDDAARIKAASRLPLSVEIRFALQEEEDKDEGEFEIERVTDKEGEELSRVLELRLQTIPREDGFWMDTGTVYDV